MKVQERENDGGILCKRIIQNERHRFPLEKFLQVLSTISEE
jgi:hypothetical protein